MMPRPHTIRLKVRREHNTHGLESSLLRGRDPPAPPPCIMRRCITDKVWIETTAIHTWRAGHTPRSTKLLFPVGRLQAQCGKTLPLAHTRSLKRQIARHVSKLPSSFHHHRLGLCPRLLFCRERSFGPVYHWPGPISKTKARAVRADLVVQARQHLNVDIFVVIVAMKTPKCCCA